MARVDVGWKKVEVGAVRTMVSLKARKRPTWVGDMVICAPGVHDRSHYGLVYFYLHSHQFISFFLRMILDRLLST